MTCLVTSFLSALNDHHPLLTQDADPDIVMPLPRMHLYLLPRQSIPQSATWGVGHELGKSLRLACYIKYCNASDLLGKPVSGTSLYCGPRQVVLSGGAGLTVVSQLTSVPTTSNENSTESMLSSSTGG